MINRNIHGRSAVSDDPTGELGYDLSTPPEAPLPTDPVDNSLAMLGSAGSGADNGAMLPSEAGPTGQALAGLGMMINGAEMVSALVPGFVPVEISAWLQQAMQMLPQMLQQIQSMQPMMGAPGMGLGAGMPMGGQQMGGPAMMGPAPSGGPSGAPPSGPPRRPMQ